LNKPAPPEDLAWILEKTRSVIESADFKNERILLTGATGFFGKWLTQTLLVMNDKWQLKNELFIVTRSQKRAEEGLPWLRQRNEVHFLEADIRSFVSNEKFSTIIHGAAAASAALNENQPEEMFNTIVEGTKRVLQIAETSGCKRFQLVSSGGVYGPQPSNITRIPETYLGAPNTLSPSAAYGEAKRSAEMFSALAAKRAKFKLSIPRCFAFIGPYLPLDMHFAAGNFLLNVLKQEPIHIQGDGTTVRSYMYAADLMIWLIVLLLKGEDGRTYNVGAENECSIADLAHTIHEAGLKVFPTRPPLKSPVEIMKKADLFAKPARYVPSTAAAQELGLKTWTSLEKAAEKTLRWHTN